MSQKGTRAPRISRRSISLEEDMALQIRAAGLPTPEREAMVIPGRRFRADFAWRDAAVVLEIEGGIFAQRNRGGTSGHSSAAGILRDIEKSNLYTIHGWRLIRAAAPHVRNGEAIAWVAAALGVEI
jgi:very-short-patch-repair endonuclease